MARHRQAPLRRFERMSRLKDYAVEKGMADPRGWKVLDGAGLEVGQVRDLIIDTDRMAATYLEVELDTRSFAHEDPIILVPITRAERDGTQNRLIVSELSRSRIATLFDARAADEASFWERWWSEPAPEQHTAPLLAHEPPPVVETREAAPVRPAPRPADPLDVDRPRDVEPDRAHMHRERIAARDLDEPRHEPPVHTGPVRRDELDEPDPLEDPQYRRALDPGERRRFDE